MRRAADMMSRCVRIIGVSSQNPMKYHSQDKNKKGVSITKYHGRKLMSLCKLAVKPK